MVLRFHAPIDGKIAPRFLKVSITNQGKWPLHIPANFFYWKAPFKRGFMVVMPLDLTDSPLIPPKHYPTKISLRASADFTISDVDTFEQHVKRVRGADTFADRLRFRFIRAFVQMDDGETFRVKRSPKAREV